MTTVSAKTAGLTVDYFTRQLKRIVEAAQRVGGLQDFDVLFVTNRPEYFDISEFNSLCGGTIRSVTFVSNSRQLPEIKRSFDIGIVCSHVTDGDVDAMIHIRASNLVQFLFVWTFDNHHNFLSNVRVNALSDAVVPAHNFCAGYMRTPSTVLGQHVPISTHQWSRETARRFFAETALAERKDGLQGGFISWSIGEREDLIKKCQVSLPDNAITILDSAWRQNYFDKSPRQRWDEWASYKAGLILPLTFDLSGRLFDSLITGQVPIVPTWFHDLDIVIPLEVQQSLPIIRFSEASVEAVEGAWKEALRRFATDGSQGALRRHRFAIDHHHLVNRIQAICHQVRQIASSTSDIFIRRRWNRGFCWRNPSSMPSLGFAGKPRSQRLA